MFRKGTVWKTFVAELEVNRLPFRRRAKVQESRGSEVAGSKWQPVVAQLPPTLRGILGRETKPRVDFAFQGCSVCGLGGRLGVEAAASEG
jgi:hypothetical protein